MCCEWRVFDIAFGLGLCRALGAGQDLKSFDVDNKYGVDALKRIMDDCCGDSLPLVEVRIEHSAHYLRSVPVMYDNIGHVISSQQESADNGSEYVLAEVSFKAPILVPTLGNCPITLCCRHWLQSTLFCS